MQTISGNGFSWCTGAFLSLNPRIQNFLYLKLLGKISRAGVVADQYLSSEIEMRVCSIKVRSQIVPVHRGFQHEIRLLTSL